MPQSFSPKTLKWVAAENLWNLWVPKLYGGLETPFKEGLRKLQSLAKKDGSLGWTVTLCSGANYFIGFLPEKSRHIIFDPDKNPPILGGSGGAFGTAEKTESGYLLNGTWHYATGSIYLTHFTLTAKLTQNGSFIRDENGEVQQRSFIVPQSAVNIIQNWNAMGLKASATHSFKVEDVVVSQEFSFVYNAVKIDQPLFKIPFFTFADLTLWVNYIGMAEHYLEEVPQNHFTENERKKLQKAIDEANHNLYNFADKVEKETEGDLIPNQDFQHHIHQTAVTSVRAISLAIITIHPLLGLKASRLDHPLNEVFRDYFTATQHRIFTE